jgi:hypothetical protein
MVVVVVAVAMVVVVAAALTDTIHCAVSVACFDCIYSTQVDTNAFLKFSLILLNHEYSFDALSWYHFSKMSLSNLDNESYTS